MRGLVLLLLTLVSLSTASVFGQETNKSVNTTTARLDKLRADGYEALYNLDYVGARRRFEEMSRLFQIIPPDRNPSPRVCGCST